MPLTWQSVVLSDEHLEFLTQSSELFLVGMEMKRREQQLARSAYPNIARSISEEFSSTGGELTSQSDRANRNKDMQDDYPSPKEKDKDEEVIKVFDGESNLHARTGAYYILDMLRRINLNPYFPIESIRIPTVSI